VPSSISNRQSAIHLPHHRAVDAFDTVIHKPAFARTSTVRSSVTQASAPNILATWRPTSSDDTSRSWR
jgi:hypothetical protein